MKEEGVSQSLNQSRRLHENVAAFGGFSFGAAAAWIFTTGIDVLAGYGGNWMSDVVSMAALWPIVWFPFLIVWHLRRYGVERVIVAAPILSFVVSYIPSYNLLS